MKILSLLYLLFFSQHLHSKAIFTNAIYGEDDRGIVSEKSPQFIKEISKSVGMIVSTDSLDRGFINTTVKSLSLKEQPMQNMCIKDKFSEKKSIDACTGFLVSDELFVSAGHCFVSEMDCKTKSVVFDVLEDSETQEGYKISNNSVYSCEKIIKSQIDSEKLIDFAIIKLNRKVIERAPLNLSRNIILADQAKVFMIGHPMGMVQIYTKESKIVSNNNEHFFKVAIDSFEGNSGSPIINSETLEVEGILVRGEEDFIYDEINQCNLIKKYNEDNNSSGESINRITDILDVLGFEK